MPLLVSMRQSSYCDNHRDQWRGLRRHPSPLRKENDVNNILLVVLIVLLIGALPTWPYSANWGYYPSGGLGLVLLILLVLLLSGRLSGRRT